MRTGRDTLIDRGGLLLGGAIGIVFLISLYDRVNSVLNYREMQISEALIAGSITLLVLLLLIVQAFGILHRFTYKRQRMSPRLAIARLIIAIAIISLVLIVNRSDFPGIWAATEVRQQWAAKEFQGYESVVNSIERCAAVVDRVGQVKFVAPTRGSNYVLSEPGSSGHYGELTLEVVGDEAIGVANFGFHINTSVGWVQFTHHGKTENLKCF